MPDRLAIFALRLAFLPFDFCLLIFALSFNSFQQFIKLGARASLSARLIPVAKLLAEPAEEPGALCLAGDGPQNVFPRGAQKPEITSVFLPDACLQPAAQLPRQRRTASGSGNRNLQVT